MHILDRNVLTIGTIFYMNIWFHSVQNSIAHSISHKAKKSSFDSNWREYNRIIWPSSSQISWSLRKIRVSAKSKRSLQNTVASISNIIFCNTRLHLTQLQLRAFNPHAEGAQAAIEVVLTLYEFLSREMDDLWVIHSGWILGKVTQRN